MSQREEVGGMQKLPVNITLKILSSEVSDWYLVHVRGRVLAPASMAGRIVEVRYMDMRDAVANSEMRDAVATAKSRGVKWMPEPAALEHMQHVHDSLSREFAPKKLMFFYACHFYRLLDGGVECWRSRRVEHIDGEGERAIINGLCRVRWKRGSENGGRDKVHVDVLYPEKAVALRNEEDFRLFFERYMAPRLDDREYNANCVIRIIAPKLDQVMLAWLFAAREWTGKFSVPASTSKTWEEAIHEGLQSDGLPRVVAAALGVRVGEMSEKHQELAKSLAADLANGDIVLEAIPGERIRVIYQHIVQQSSIAFAAASCTFGEELRFVPMTCVVMLGGAQADASRGRSVIMSKLMPEYSYTHYATKEIPTYNYNQLGDSGIAVVHGNSEYSGRVSPAGRYFVESENE